MRRQPLAAAALALMAGIGLWRVAGPVGWWPWVVALVLAAAVAAVALACRRRWAVWPLLAAMVALGGLMGQSSADAGGDAGVGASASRRAAAPESRAPLLTRASAWRQALVRRMEDGPLRNRGVAEAMALGWRADVDADTWANYRAAGVAHLLCVSGLHVGLLAGVVRWLLWPLGRDRRGRRVSGVLRLLAVWGFALLTGLASATVRAALMVSLFIVADVAGRRTPGMNLLGAAALATLAVRPTLMFDVGWQLSYAAVVGILLVQPLTAQFRSSLAQGVAVSTAAQLATLPIVAAVFGRFSLLFLVANTVLIPLAGVTLVASLAYVAVPTAATAVPLDALLDLGDGLTRWVAGLPGAVVDTTGLPVWGLLVMTACVLLLLLGAAPMARLLGGSRSGGLG